MTTNTDSTALGNLYLYRHKGWQDGSPDWGDGRQLVGEGGWQEYKSVFASSDGTMYAIDWDGNLWWDRYQSGQTDGGDGWSGKSLVGEGGWATYKSVFATTNGILYAVDWDGNLYWYRHEGWQTGANEWAEKGRQLISEGGWQEYTSVFATSDGVIYAITPDGDLYWYKHKGWETGTNEWAEKGRQLVGQGGWQEFRNVFATEGGSHYLVQKYITGDDLSVLLERNGGPIKLHEVLRIADHVLEVLEYLHFFRPPIIHRDIKPSNIKITQQGKIFLLDFGLAKGAAGLMSTLMSEASIAGATPGYAPPEQLRGIGTDERSDLFSLSATLYQLMTCHFAASCNRPS